MKKLLGVYLLCIGIFAVIMAIVIFDSYSGMYGYRENYNGDAYTGIQNATAQTATNVLQTNYILKKGLGSILMAGGLSLIGIGFNMLIQKKNTEIETQQNQSAAAELKKYKTLYDQGAITAEEFLAEKERILKLI